MLQVDLRELARGPVETKAELAGDDPLFEGAAVALADPVAVGGRLQAAGDGRFYWHGSLRTRVSGECRRCLTPVSRVVTAVIGVLFTQDPDALEDPDSYPLPPEATVIDLTPAVREEMLLAVQLSLDCGPDCRGLIPRCGQDLYEEPCGCAPATADPRWTALAALKGKFRD